MAVHALDMGAVWPETQIHGIHYQDLAVSAAKNGKNDLALAVALDNDRILAGRAAKHFDEVYAGDNAYRMAEFANGWLSNTTPIFGTVLQNGADQNGAALKLFGAKIDLYTEILAAQSNETGFPRPERSNSETNWLAVSIGSVCRTLWDTGQIERVERLNRLDPEVGLYFNPSA